jgi:hypothetical protein
MEKVGAIPDVVTYNALLDSISDNTTLSRQLFVEGIRKGFYARVSRLGKQWLELDLHFLSLGGAEVALRWWFESCLLPYFVNTGNLDEIKSISIVTGFGKTRLRGRRHGDDGIRKRVKAILKFMNVDEIIQENAGRILLDPEKLNLEAQKNGGKIIFDEEGFQRFKASEFVDDGPTKEPQKIRARFRPQNPNSASPPFVRVETDRTSPEYRIDASGNIPHSTLFDGVPESGTVRDLMSLLDERDFSKSSEPEVSTSTEQNGSSSVTGQPGLGETINPYEVEQSNEPKSHDNREENVSFALVISKD